MEVEAPQMEFTPPDWSTDEDESYKNDETDDADESDEADDADESYKTDLWRDLLKWFRQKINALDDDGPDRVLERMQKIIFKKVKKVHSSDIWHPDRVTQPEEEEGNEEEKEEEEEEQEEEEESGGNHHLVMVSKEYTAVLIKATLVRREDYLRKKGLPLEYNMYDDEPNVLKPFLEEVRTEYESEAHQRKLQERDHRRKKDGTSKRSVHAGRRRRWAREMQRRCGSKLFWELVSFTGKWDPDWFEILIDRDAEAASKEEENKKKQAEQKALTRAAIEARASFRYAKHLNRRYQNQMWEEFTCGQQTLLRKFWNDDLRREKNEATMKSTNGRLVAQNGFYMDIGGNASRSASRRACVGYVAPDHEDIDWF